MICDYCEKELYPGCKRDTPMRKRNLCMAYSADTELAEYLATGYAANEIEDMHDDLCRICGKYKQPEQCAGCRWKPKKKAQKG